ncbi:hypothetical protein GQ53DRAFT_821918 [Thozetella sp. PMI_491]|nr:hypothetical protein GQ53DRAFT_821918 [Thozetella sp. PMI_491]
MVSPLAPVSGFRGLPFDIRHLLYEHLAEIEDMTSLMQACRQLREEVLSRMPGGRNIDYSSLNYGNMRDRHNLLRQIKKVVYISSLRIIAEPWFSSGSALKFSVYWGYRGSYELRSTTWTVRDLSSPMTWFALVFSTKSCTVAFEAPTHGHMLTALLILRTKVFDICRFLMLRARKNAGIDVVFQGGEMDIMSVGANTRGTDFATHNWFWELRAATAKFPPRSGLSRSFEVEFPYFYECLLLPLYDCRCSLPEAIYFDDEKPRSGWRYTSAKRLGLDHRLYVDFRGPFISLSAKLGDYRKGAKYPTWGFLQKSLEMMEATRRLSAFSRHISSFLVGSGCREEDQLRSYLRRMRESHRVNYFAGHEIINSLDDSEIFPEWTYNEDWLYYNDDNDMSGPEFEEDEDDEIKGSYNEDDDMRESLITWALNDSV